MSNRARVAVIGAGLAVLIAGAVALVVVPTRPAALPAIADLNMPIPRTPFDRALTISSKPGVTLRGETRLEIESRYGQFRGHWWWDKGWVYVSGGVLPGSRIRVQIDNRSLTISDTPDRQAVAQVRRYGLEAISIDYVQVDVVRFGIGAALFSTRTAGGPFHGRHVVDKLDARAWSTRGLLIARDQVTSSPPDRIPCTLMQQPVNGWNWGCRLLGQPPLISDRRGRFPASSDPVEAYGISLTSTPGERTQLPADSMRVNW